MVPELSILKYLLKYQNHQKYIKYIELPNEMRELQILYHTLEALHSKFPDTDKSLDELQAYIGVCYPVQSKSEQQDLNAIIERIQKTEIADDIAQTLVASLKTRNKARALALAALDVSEGRRAASDLSGLVADVSEQSTEDSDDSDSRNFVTDRLDALRDHTINSNGLYWPLGCLNASLGPLRVGDFGFVFARPESGKTTFLAHTAAFMSQQATGPIIWFNNEEQGEKVRVRTFQAAIGCTTDELFRNIEKNQKQYDDFTKGNIRIYDDGSIHRRDVERIVLASKPAMVIFDQIDKIRGFDADRPDLVFGRIYQWARELAKDCCPVVGVCQSDGTGEGVKWLTMGHVAEAKTSKQAEADWILGIGRSNEGGTESVRYFNISKNKLMGDKKTDPELRHGRFDVYIRPQIARYEDVID